MSDETVSVPAALVEALRYRLQVHRAEGSLICPCTVAARALVDAAERPDEGETCCKCGPTPYPGTDAPMEDCPVHYPPPAPLSSPRRTRDEGPGQCDCPKFSMTEYAKDTRDE